MKTTLLDESLQMKPKSHIESDYEQIFLKDLEITTAYLQLKRKRKKIVPQEYLYAIACESNFGDHSFDTAPAIENSDDLFDPNYFSFRGNSGIS